MRGDWRGHVGRLGTFSDLSICDNTLASAPKVFRLNRLAEGLDIMAQSRSSLRFVSVLLLLLLPARLNASPAITTDGNSLLSLNSTVTPIASRCYTPESGGDTPEIPYTNLQACQDALSVLVHTPDFAGRFRFSRNPRAMAKKLPIGWQLGTHARCRIVVNCENDRDTAVFRLADIAHEARNIINTCVDQPDPSGRYALLRWGGVHGLLSENTFYVAVASPAEPELEIEVANRTAPAGLVLIEGGSEVS